MVLGSDKPCEGVATSLRFPSQPGSFTPGKYGSEAGPPDGQPDSPIKTSPVSERIKALEALAAKKKEPDFRSDGGYAHFRDRHHEKSPTEPTKSPTEPTKSPTEPTKSPTETTKSPVEKIAPTVQKRGSSVEPESPESPFEVLGDLKQVGEFEETEEWMKAHLPPVPDLDAVGLTKGPQTADSVPSKELKETDVAVPDAPAAFAGVPDAFMDSPVESPEMKDKFSDSQQPSVEEESEFDLSFLPTAYMWDQQEKPGVQAPSNVSSVLPASPAPPAGFDSPSSPVLPPAATDTQQNVPGDVKPTWTGDLEPPETSEVDSSGESDDTVIEDGVTVPPSSHQAIPHDPSSIDLSASAAQSLPSEEKETPPPRSERKLMQVPTINVIETDEPNYSDEEMEMEAEEEDYEVVKDTAGVAPITSESEDYKNEPPKTRPIETEFMEGYSPPSSPVDSDAEYSPKHKILKPLPETDSQVSEQPENLPTQTDSKVLASEFTEAQPDESQHFSNKGNDESSPFIVTNEEVDFPDNDDEWSDEAQEILVKPTKVDFALEQNPYGDFRVGEKNSTVPKDPYLESSSIPKTSFMQDDIYDRQSFDYDYDVSSPLDDIDDKGLNDKDHLLSDSSEIHVETLSPSTAPSDQPNIGNFTPLNDDETSKPVAQPSLRDYPEDPYSSFQMGTLSSVTEQDFNKKVTGDIGTDSIANGDSISGQKFNPKAAENPDLDGTVSEPSDSFVDFMRECLKSRQDEEAAEAYQGVRSRSELCNPGMTPSQSPPTMVTDLEQEQLTISVLKELGSSQEEEEDVVSVKSNIPSQDKVSSNQASVQQSSITSVPNPPCSQSNRAFGSTYSEEVDAIDEWVAEAYHLAEHVLTAILTHLSGKTFFPPGVRPANPMHSLQKEPLSHLHLDITNSFFLKCFT